MKKIVLLLLLFINGCASQNPFELSQEGPTMKENYDNHTSGILGNPSSEDFAPNSNIGRELENDINYSMVNEFAYKRISNPELKMFIYPHRSELNSVVIPAYSVSFPMYLKVQYSLVGDIVNGY
ncbi:hypothetical protein CXF64_20025 [Pseudoalteromonas sp. GutCa3]|nr:hypothetical protein CXF64_20025 [Pseudoalteromonas sp. GutCa3]